MRSDIVENLVPIGALLLGLGLGWAWGGLTAAPEPAPAAPVAEAAPAAASGEQCAQKLAPLEQRYADHSVRQALMRYEMSEAWQ